MSDELAKKPEDSLTESEREELFKWRRTADAAPLALSLSVRMYELFLLGHSCDAIAKANDNRFPLGMILDARVRHQWDKHRDEEVSRLLKDVGTVVRQRQAEGAMFLGDLLASAHLQFGQQLRKFIQTRDPKDIPDQFRVDSLTKYKMVLHALELIIGTDDKKSAPSVQVFTQNATLQEGGSKKLTPDDAFKFLEALDQEDKK
jgi:hypothetical protein